MRNKSVNRGRHESNRSIRSRSELDSRTENSAKTVRGNPDKTASHRWKPGESGNPGGRPRTAALSQACRQVLAAPVDGDPEGRTHAEVIAQNLANKALKGDVRAIQELADRAEGKSRQPVDMNIPGPHVLSEADRAAALAIIDKLKEE